MKWTIIRMQETPDTHGNPDEPYLCGIRHLLGMMLLGRVEWWEFTLKDIKWQIKRRRLKRKEARKIN